MSGFVVSFCRIGGLRFVHMYRDIGYRRCGETRIYCIERNFLTIKFAVQLRTIIRYKTITLRKILVLTQSKFHSALSAMFYINI